MTTRETADQFLSSLDLLPSIEVRSEILARAGDALEAARYQTSIGNLPAAEQEAEFAREILAALRDYLLADSPCVPATAR